MKNIVLTAGEIYKIQRRVRQYRRVHPAITSRRAYKTALQAAILERKQTGPRT